MLPQLCHGSTGQHRAHSCDSSASQHPRRNPPVLPLRSKSSMHSARNQHQVGGSCALTRSCGPTQEATAATAITAMRSGGGHGRQRLLETIAAAREAAASRVAAHAAAEAAAGAPVRRRSMHSPACTQRRPSFCFCAPSYCICEPSCAGMYWTRLQHQVH